MELENIDDWTGLLLKKSWAKTKGLINISINEVPIGSAIREMQKVTATADKDIETAEGLFRMAIRFQIQYEYHIRNN